MFVVKCFLAVNTSFDDDLDVLGGGLPDGYRIHLGVEIPSVSFQVLASKKHIQADIFVKAVKVLSMVAHLVVKHGF